MLCRMFILLSTLMLCLRAHGMPQVQFRVSHTHGLYNFVETISGLPNHSRTLREEFEKSTFHDEKAKALLAEFVALRQDLDVGFDFPDFPDQRSQGQRLSALLAIASIQAADLRDFEQRAAGILPIDTHVKLFSVLKRFEPIYDAFLWRRSKPGLVTYVKALEKSARDWKMSEMFARVERFYGANWPDDLPFVVGVFPLPDVRGASNAEAMGMFESVGVFVDPEDIPGRYGVVFHEICHSLFSSQPRPLQQELEDWFLKGTGWEGRMAYSLLNEAMATALGNGIAEGSAIGTLPRGEWYHDPLIDGYGKALVPVLKRWLASGKRMDASFAAEAVDVFRKTFPDVARRFDANLRSVNLAWDGIPEGGRIADELRQRFRVLSIWRMSPVNAQETLELLSEGQTTQLVVVSSQEVAQAKALDALGAPVMRRFADFSKTPAPVLLADFDAGGRLWILMKAESLADVRALVAEMAEHPVVKAGELVQPEPGTP